MLLIVLISLTFDIAEKNKDKAVEKAIGKLIEQHFVSETLLKYEQFGFKIFPHILKLNSDIFFRVKPEKKGFIVEFLEDEYNRFIKPGKINIKIPGFGIPTSIDIDTARLMLKPDMNLTRNLDSIVNIRNTGNYAMINVGVLFDGIDIKKLEYLKPDSSIDIVADPWLSHELIIRSKNFQKNFKIPARVPIEFYPSIKTPFSDVLSGDRIVNSIEIVNLKDSIIKSVIVEEKFACDGKILSEPKKFSIDIKPQGDTILTFNSFTVPEEAKRLTIRLKVIFKEFTKNLDYTINVHPYYHLFDEEKPLSTKIKRSGIGLCYGYDDSGTSTYFRRDAFIISEYFQNIFGCKGKHFKDRNEFLKAIRSNYGIFIVFIAGIVKKERNKILIGNLEMNSLLQNLKLVSADTVIIFFDLPYKDDARFLENFRLKKVGKNFAYFIVSYHYNEWKFENRKGLLTSLLIKYLNNRNIRNLADLQKAIETEIGNKAKIKVNNLSKFVMR